MLQTLATVWPMWNGNNEGMTDEDMTKKTNSNIWKVNCLISLHASFFGITPILHAPPQPLFKLFPDASFGLYFKLHQKPCMNPLAIHICLRILGQDPWGGNTVTSCNNHVTFADKLWLVLSHSPLLSLLHYFVPMLELSHQLPNLDSVKNRFSDLAKVQIGWDW